MVWLSATTTPAVWWIILGLSALIALVAGIGLWSARRALKKLPPSVTVALRRRGQAPYAEPDEVGPHGEAGSGKPLVTAVEGPLAGKSAPVGKRPLRIGRDPKTCALCFPFDHPEVSRVHCAILYDPKAACFYVEDCGSTNGTFLEDGVRMEPNRMFRIIPGGIIAVGTPGNRFRLDLAETESDRVSS